ncbi:MAG: hypothetical protein IPL71_14165 [Anaerolineales bacterium]|uniref:hypothetical protein n=1 Tax=Candidatus Villigracilis proximus TaxID=3140683 RepID=UPI003134E561|nr:hypothetical protein [Anaerolineales bacterium]
MRAEMARALLITLFGISVIPFYSVSVDILEVLSSSIYRWFMLVALVLCLSWNFYFGPYFFASRRGVKFNYFDKKFFKIYLRPYIAWAFLSLCHIWRHRSVYFLLITHGVANDFVSVQHNVIGLQSLPINDIPSIQFSTMRLIQFGDFTSAISQKYILTVVLVFVYVVIEQRSSMHYTILDNSVERVKYFVWALLLFAVLFSMVYLPDQYMQIHERLRHQVEVMSFSDLYPDYLGTALSLQKTLEDHDAQWLYLSIITGYGNLITASVVATVVFFWKMLFDKAPPRVIARLFVPKPLMDGFERFGQGFSIDVNLEDERS